MTDLEIREDAARVRVSRDVVNIVNEREPWWRIALGNSRWDVLCVTAFAILLLMGAMA